MTGAHSSPTTRTSVGSEARYARLEVMPEYEWEAEGPIVGFQKPVKARKARAAAKPRKARAKKAKKPRKPRTRRTRKQKYTYDDDTPVRGGGTRGGAQLRRDVTKVAEKAVQRGLEAALDPNVRAAAKAVGRLRVSDVARAGKVGAGLLGGVALAGVAAYALTRYLVTRKPRKREEQLQAAFEASQALRAARADAAAQQGEPLTPAQNRQLGAIFQKKLKSLGITNFSQKG